MGGNWRSRATGVSNGGSEPVQQGVEPLMPATGKYRRQCYDPHLKTMIKPKHFFKNTLELVRWSEGNPEFSPVPPQAAGLCCSAEGQLWSQSGKCATFKFFSFSHN